MVPWRPKCRLQFSSVHSLNHVRLWDPVDCNMPGFPVLHHLPEFVQFHVPWVGDYPTISSSVALFPSCPQSFPSSGSFPMSQFFASRGQSTGVSALASVLPMNIQDWFPLGLTGLISLLSKGLSRVFFHTTVQRHQFFSLLYGTTLTTIHDYWKNHSFN